MTPPRDPDTPCPTCGHEHPGCSAHNRQGNPCGQTPIPGGAVCYWHGGNAPQVRRMAEQRMAVVRATEFLASIDIDPSEYEDPMQGLLEEVTRSSRVVAFWGRIITELDVPDVTEENPFARTIIGMNAAGRPYYSQPVGQVYGPDADRNLALHVALNTWNAERERHAKLCKMAIDAGIAERMVERAQREATVLVQVVMAVVSDPSLALNAEQQDAARVAIGRQLRAIETTGVPA